MGILLALAGPWLAPFFVNASDPNAAAVIKLSTAILWIASAYQVFDGLYTGSALCLRGAGDAKAPAIAAAFLSWLGFVPLAHMLFFRPGEGWGNFFPQFGFGAEGGWFAAVIYTCLLGVLVFWRWRSGAWRRIEVI